ncbi:lipase family protein [Nocardia jiangxiensis]|uniref:Lipase family protein n=1 Tax=Nocardia jiangxiensis TaxID=282685 RepID=A0ABW6RXB3_9NOCA|nr:lipase family protein [Nocardia jiangxiensis]
MKSGHRSPTYQENPSHTACSTTDALGLAADGATPQPAKWRRIGRLWLAALTFTMITLPAALAIPAAQAAVLPPAEDPFYSAPADLAAHPNGAVLGARPISLLGLPVPVSAWQLRYRTTDSEQHPQLDVTTVLVPPMPSNGPRPVLAYQVPENSLDTRCAPSATLRGGGDMASTMQDAPFIADALRRGWAVVVSDYEGPNSRLFDGVTSGRGVLDGIRAARSYPATGINAASPIGAWGYSAGAFATLWATQLRHEYAPDVRFAGTSAGGIPTDIPAMAQRADGEAGAILILLGLARDEPGSRLADLLNNRGQRALLTADTSACGADQAKRYADVHIEDLAKVPNLLAQNAFRIAAAPNELGRTAPDTPMYLYHSLTDDKIPVAGYNALLGSYCAQGATLTAIHSLFPMHLGAAAGEAFGAMNFLADRFAGVPQTRGCVVH